MKPLIFFFFLLNFSVINGQDTAHNFRIENGELIWQKVFETKLTQAEFIKQLKANGIFDKVVIDSFQISGELRQFNCDYKDAGYSEMLTPIYIARSHINAFALVEFKEGKYRATVKKIVLTQAYDDPLSKQGEKTDIEIYAIKKEHLTTAFKKSPSIILNFTFNKLLEIKNAENKNW